jgi:preprotein translocase subunit SecE
LNSPEIAANTPLDLYRNTPMARTNPMQFAQQVRAEVSKIVWPSRKETGITTVMVFIMATLFAIFFSVVDISARAGLDAIINFAS